MAGCQSHVSASFYEMLCAHAGVALIATDADLAVCMWNEAATRMLGLEASAMLGRHVTEVVPAAQRAMAEDHFRRAVADGEVSAFDMDHEDADGRPVHLAVTISPVTDEAGTHIGASAWIRNITQRVLLQERAGRNQKMASLGALAGSVAHHFNNLLGGVVTCVDYARETGDPRATRRALEVTTDAVARATRLTQHLLAFAEGDRRHADLADLTETVLFFAEQAEERTRDRGVRLAVMIEPVPVIEVPATRLLTVLGNLLDNSLEAMPSGGAVELRLAPQDDQVLLRMADSGEGVRREDLDRVFEPFFSTKTFDTSPASDHSGLGLAAAHGIVKELGGEITVSSGPEGGCCVDILLPIRRPDPA